MTSVFHAVSVVYLYEIEMIVANFEGIIVEVEKDF